MFEQTNLQDLVEQLQEFCELQLSRTVTDEFDNGTNWLATVIVDMINEARFNERLEQLRLAEEQE